MEAVALILIAGALFCHSWYILGLYPDGRTVGIYIGALALASLITITFAPLVLTNTGADGLAQTTLMKILIIVWSGYGKPLYLLPMYQQKSAIGGKGCPFACPHYEGHVDYSIGICPVVEKVEKESLFMNDFIRPPATVEDMRDVVRAFEKVYEHKEQLLGR